MRTMKAVEILPCLCTCDKSSLVDLLYCNRYDVQEARKILLEILRSFGMRMLIVYPVVTPGDFGNKDYVSLNYVRKFNNNFWKCADTSGILLLGKYIKTVHCPDILFHGTSSVNLSRILEEGLNPLKAGQVWKEDVVYSGAKKFVLPRSYLTDSLYAAEYFAQVAEKRIGGTPIILKVNVKGVKESLFLDIEQFEKENEPTKVGFDTYKEFWFEQSLPPSRIKGWHIIPTRSLSLVMFAVQEYFQKEVSKNPELKAIRDYYQQFHENIRKSLQSEMNKKT